MGLEVGSRFDVLANSFAESCVDDVPLVRHLRRRSAQYLIDQVAILPRLRSLALRPRYQVAAVLRPRFLVGHTAQHEHPTQEVTAMLFFLQLSLPPRWRQGVIGCYSIR